MNIYKYKYNYLPHVFTWDEHVHQWSFSFIPQVLGQVCISEFFKKLDLVPRCEFPTKIYGTICCVKHFYLQKSTVPSVALSIFSY